MQSVSITIKIWECNSCPCKVYSAVKLINTNKKNINDRLNAIKIQGLKNPLARRPGLVISTFGLAEIISCMPNGLVKKYIGY
jgi:hypothetical protein